MALMDVYRVICIPMAAFYFFYGVSASGKEELEQSF